ncbi:MAG: hypothetical protein ACYC18_07555 [Gammaproteobacteria bacterium]|nr:hypothetical protein [Gammaproteobacteria bacterium]
MMHCLVETDLGRIADPDAAVTRLAQALLQLLDRQPDRALYSAACHTGAGRLTLSLDLAAARLELASQDHAVAPDVWWDAPLDRLARAARGTGLAL